MLLKFLKKVKDKRRAQSKQYQLHYIILLSILAILSGAKSYRGIERFIKIKFKRLKRIFRLKWKRPPAYTTIRNIILGIDKDLLEKEFREYAKYLLSLDNLAKRKCTAIDGKTLRGSFDNFEDRNAVHVLEVFCTTNYLILAHQEVEAKTNEIPVAQELMEKLDIKDSIITLDALHCQTNTFRAIKKGAVTV
jgi:hypothetical protein